jgi:hypothetical protein
MVGLGPCLEQAVLVVLRGCGLAGAARAAAVDEDQRQRSRLVEAIHRNGRELEAAVGAPVREDKARRKDWRAYVGVDCYVVGSFLDDRTDHRQAEVHMAQLASLLVRHQRGHHYASHKLMQPDRRNALSVAPQEFGQRSKWRCGRRRQRRAPRETAPSREASMSQKR